MSQLRPVGHRVLLGLMTSHRGSWDQSGQHQLLKRVKACGLNTHLILPLMRTTGKQEVKKKVLVLKIRMC